jgi:hypothetical protein
MVAELIFYTLATLYVGSQLPYINVKYREMVIAVWTIAVAGIAIILEEINIS